MKIRHLFNRLPYLSAHLIAGEASQPADGIDHGTESAFRRRVRGEGVVKLEKGPVPGVRVPDKLMRSHSVDFLSRIRIWWLAFDAAPH